MGTARTIEWTDERMLTALFMRDHEGRSAAKIAVQFDTSRSAVLGMLFRVDRELAKTDQTGRQNGTMDPDWWKNRKRHT